MKMVQIAWQYWIAVIKLHRGQYVYQVPCMFYLYLYLYISLFLSLSISTSVSISILNFSSVYSSTHPPPSGSQQARVQQKDCLPPITTSVPSSVFQGERTWPGTSTSTWRATTTGCSKLSIDQVGSLEIIGFDLCYCLQGPYRERYTPWKIDNSWFETCKWWWILWFRWCFFFSGFQFFSDFCWVNQPFIFQGVPLKNGRRLFPWFLPTFWEVCKENHFLETAEGKGYGRVSRNKNELDHLCHYLLIAGLL